MGSPKSEKGRDDDEKLHKVRITRGFYMGVTEVTQEQWKKIMGNTPSRFSGCDDCPVENVSWWDVQKFIQRLNEIEGTNKFRLPTEAEWEYACRVGTMTARFWGDDPDDACQYGNVHDLTSKRINKFSWTHYYCDDGYAKTAPVKSFRPNPWGLYDMLGNVWEWCLDICTGNYSDISVDDPVYIGKWVSIYRKGYSYIYDTLKAKGARRVVRGGSWFNLPRCERCANRGYIHLGIRYNNVGFRLLCSVK